MKRSFSQTSSRLDDNGPRTPELNSGLGLLDNDRSRVKREKLLDRSPEYHPDNGLRVDRLLDHRLQPLNMPSLNLSEGRSESSGKSEIAAAMDDDVLPSPRLEGQQRPIPCYIEYPELRELLFNSNELRHCTTTDIENMDNHWGFFSTDEEKTDEVIKVYNPALQRLVRHINAKIQLKKALSDTTSRIGLIASRMTTNDKELLEWRNLDLYAVLKHMPRYNIDKDLVSNIQFHFALKDKVLLSFNEVAKLARIVLHKQGLTKELPLTYGPGSPKKWHCDIFHNSPVILSGPNVLSELEKDAFAMVISSQQQSSPQTISSITPHTVVVATLCHGMYLYVGAGAQDIPMYTVPAGKTITIISVATPSAIEINAGDMPELEIIRNMVSDFNLRNEFINPHLFIDNFNRGIIEYKTKRREWGLSGLLGHLNPDWLNHYLKTWTEPRFLFFNEGDKCLNKGYSNFPGRKKQLLKFNFNGWDQELMPPDKIDNDRPYYYLNEMCNQLFLDDKCINIVIFDWSCSTLSEGMPEELSDVFMRNALKYRLNGGRRYY